MSWADFPPILCKNFYMKVKVTELRLTLCDPMDGSLPGSSVCGILQAGILLFPSLGDLPSPEFEPRSLPLPADSLPSELPWKPIKCLGFTTSGDFWVWSFLCVKILTTNSICLIDMELLKVSIYSEVSFSSLYLLRNLFISSKLLNL